MTCPDEKRSSDAERTGVEEPPCHVGRRRTGSMTVSCVVRFRIFISGSVPIADPQLMSMRFSVLTVKVFDTAGTDSSAMVYKRGAIRAGSWD